MSVSHVCRHGYASIAKLVETMAEDVALRRATHFQSATFTIKLSRQRRYDGRSRQETMLLTYGTPNYVERRFIKKCRAAGEPFPVKKVQLKYWPTKKR